LVAPALDRPTAPPRPTLDLRHLIGQQPERWLEGRNLTKADIAIYRVDGMRLAVKTYARRPAWVRHGLGRWLTRREAAAYRAAGDIDGLPRFFGCPTPFALTTEWVPGRPLPELGLGLVEEEVFSEVARLLRRLHARGVALADLHHRNVLVAEDGRVFLVDLAAAWVLGDDPWPLRRALFRRLRELDFLSLARMRARWTGGDAREAVAAVGGSIAKWHTRGRRVKTLLERVRGKRRYASRAASAPSAALRRGRRP